MARPRIEFASAPFEWIAELMGMVEVSQPQSLINQNESADGPTQSDVQTQPKCPGNSKLPLNWFSPIQSILYTMIMGVVLILVLFLALVAILLILVAVLLSPLYMVALLKCRRVYRTQVLTSSAESIRLVEVMPGSCEDVIACNLITSTWNDLEYEALSYTWERSRTVANTHIQLNDKRFSLTRSLKRTLHSLRDPHVPRRLWIDVICIDQSNPLDKAAQIPKMMQIYHQATRVIAWLDPGPLEPVLYEGVRSLFSTIRTLTGVTNELQINSTVSQLSACEKAALLKLLRVSWWTRIWVVQEVAAGRVVHVQCKDLVVDFLQLCGIVTISSQLLPELKIPTRILEFIQTIHSLRSAQTAGPYGVIGLAYAFRQSNVSIEKDRFFALMSLVPESEPTSNKAYVDYLWTDNRVCMAITKQSLSRHNKLVALIGLEYQDHRVWQNLSTPLYRYIYTRNHLTPWLYERIGRQNYSPSWLYEWGGDVTNCGRLSMWNGNLSLMVLSSAPQHSAAGASSARCQTNRAYPDVVEIKGFEVDVIESVGDAYFRHLSDLTTYHLFRQWYELARSTETGSEPSLRLRFSAVCAAGVVNDLSQPQVLPVGDSEHIEIPQVIKDACTGRRLVKTKKGRLGLAHSSCQLGDLVVILLGADVPYLLRRSHHGGPTPFTHSTLLNCLFDHEGCTRSRHLNCCTPHLYRIVGQAYVEGIMQYQGDIEDDITSGRLRLQEYLIE